MLCYKNTLELAKHNNSNRFARSHQPFSQPAKQEPAIRVIGKKEPVTTYELIGLNIDPSDEITNLIETFNKARDSYKNKNWEEAIEFFKESKALEKFRFGDNIPTKTSPSEVYIERCTQYISNPPSEDWDGVFILKSK